VLAGGADGDAGQGLHRLDSLGFADDVAAGKRELETAKARQQRPHEQH